ncbi:hypothetical protein FRB94_011025 [Tulasnella sp. JGI-2019a]|nr:hypothetical protein FRB93_000594 [Tulasnella sp. JGI-2019a]KAG9010048.1 hypothetical protein FRB94_011025 [Tulasnella sp. JGI-2019a]
MSLPRILVTASHAASLAYMVWAFKVLQGFMKGIETQRGGHFQFLTIQGLLLTEATLATCLLCDFAPTVQRYARVRRLLVMVAMPLSVVISMIYWALILFMPRLIMQQASTEPSSDPLSQSGNVFGPDFRIPLPIDLALHLLPLATLTTHFFVTEEKYTPKVAGVWAPVTAALFAVWYAGFQEWCAAANGNFSYPFLNIPFPGRLVIYLATTVIAAGSFRMINSLHSGEPMIPSIYNMPKEKHI